MAHARLSGIFRTAERDARDASTGDLDLAALPGAAGRRAAQEAGHLSRGRGEGRARARAAPHHRVSPRAGHRGARLVSPHPRGRRARGPDHRAGPAPARPRRPHRAGQRASPCSASPPPTGCDPMSLLVVGSVALDSIFTPVRRDRRRPGRLRGVLQRGGLAAPPGAGGRRGRERLPGRRARAPRRRAGSTGAASSTPRARASAGRASTPTTCRAGRRWRRGSACSPTSSPSFPRPSARPSSSSSATSIPSSSSACSSQVRGPELVVCDTMNYWIQSKKAAAARAARPGRRPHGERQRGPGAERRLEHPSRRPLDPGARAQARGDQAGRARRAADRARRAPSTSRPFRWRTCSTPPAPATRSPAASWPTSRAPARWPRTTSAGPWCTARPWAPTRWSSSASAASSGSRSPTWSAGCAPSRISPTSSLAEALA